MPKVTLPNVCLYDEEYGDPRYADRTIARWRKSWEKSGITLVSAGPAAIAGQGDEYDIVMEGSEAALTKKVNFLLKKWGFPDTEIRNVLNNMEK